MNIVEIYERFPTPDDCYAHLERVRWPDGPECPKCGSDKVYRNAEKSRRSRWHCNGCRRSFSVTAGTIFHNSHIDLRKWFLLISLMLNARKGLSACQAARALGNMRRPTVWSMMHRVRRAMADDGDLLRGVVEADECYVGGKPRKGNHRDGDGGAKRGRGTDKTPVVGMVERGGRAVTRMAAKADLSFRGLARMVRDSVDTRDAILITDEYRGYAGMERIVPHITINHSLQYADGPVHTNSIESLWAVLKRAVLGQFHHISRRYTPLYLQEITYRHNRRKMAQDAVFANLLQNAVA